MAKFIPATPVQRRPRKGARRLGLRGGALRVAWLLAAIGCAPTGQTPYEEAVADFVDAWAASAAICEAPAVCGVGEPGPCAVAALPVETIDAAVRHSHLDPHSMARCENSAGEFGACIVTLDCTTLPALDVHCAAEQERYLIDCAALLVAIDYLEGNGTGGTGSGGSGGGAGGLPATGGAGSGGQATGGDVGVGGRPGTGGFGTGGQGTGGQGTGGQGTGGGPGDTPSILAGALCERAEACVGGRWSSDEQASCEAEASALFGPIVPDMAATEACLRGASCVELASDLATLVVECVDHNPAANECLSPGALMACTFAGTCSALACRDICRADGLLTLGCGQGTGEAGDECLCGN